MALTIQQEQKIIQRIPELENCRRIKNTLLLPYIRLWQVSNNYPNKGIYKSLNQFLVKDLGLSKSTASELLLVARKCYDKTGKILPVYEGFDYSALLIFSKLMWQQEEISCLINKKLVIPSMTRTEIKDITKELISTYLYLYNSNECKKGWYSCC